MQPMQEIIYKLLKLTRLSKKLGKDIHGNERWFGKGCNGLIDVHGSKPIKLPDKWEPLIVGNEVQVDPRHKHYDIRKIKVSLVENLTRIMFSTDKQLDISEILVDEKGVYYIDSEPVEIGITTYAKAIGGNAEIYLGIVGI